MPPITAQEFQMLREYVKQHCGLQIGDEKSYLIEGRLQQLLKEVGAKSFQDFYYRAKQEPSGALRDKIIDAVTTHETLWFRDDKPWKAMKEVIFPEFIKDLQLKKKNRIRVWSAACSRGQEPYSLAMMLDMYLLSQPLDTGVKLDAFDLFATDISPSVLFMAISGKFTNVDMARGLDPAWLRRYFTEEDGVWTIREDLRKKITFRRFNLQDSFVTLGRFDMILCRNVAIYFSDNFKKDLFKRLHETLSPGGVLFMGSSESLLGHTNLFEACEYQGAMFYRRK